MAATSVIIVGPQLSTTLAPTCRAQCSSQSRGLAPVSCPVGRKHSSQLNARTLQRIASNPAGNFESSKSRKRCLHQNAWRRAVRRVNAQVTENETAEEPSVAAKKEFLEDAKSLGSVRLIVNTGLGVLESVTTLEKLFYHPMPGKGLYANLMNNDDNVDFHLLLDKVARVSLVTAKSKRGDFQTHTVRFYDSESFNGASIFVMWKSGTMGEYSEGQVEAFESLVKKYGVEITFDR